MKKITYNLYMIFLISVLIGCSSSQKGDFALYETSIPNKLTSLNKVEHNIFTIHDFSCQLTIYKKGRSAVGGNLYNIEFSAVPISSCDEIEKVFINTFQLSSISFLQGNKELYLEQVEQNQTQNCQLKYLFKNVEIPAFKQPSELQIIFSYNKDEHLIKADTSFVIKDI